MTIFYSYVICVFLTDAVSTYEGSFLTLFKSPLLCVTGFCVFAKSLKIIWTILYRCVLCVFLTYDVKTYEG